MQNLKPVIFGRYKRLRKILNINKKSYIVFNIGVSKYKLKEYRSALKDFKKSIVKPKNYNTFYNKS